MEGGKNYGVILIPEGLIEQVHDVKELIGGARGYLAGHLSESFDTFSHLAALKRAGARL